MGVLVTDGAVVVGEVKTGAADLFCKYKTAPNTTAKEMIMLAVFILPL